MTWNLAMSAKLAKIQGRPGRSGGLEDGGLTKTVPGRKTICSSADAPPGSASVMVPDGALKSTTPWAPTGVVEPTVGVEWWKDMVKALRSVDVVVAAAATRDPGADEVVVGWAEAGTVVVNVTTEARMNTATGTRTRLGGKTYRRRGPATTGISCISGSTGGRYQAGGRQLGCPRG